MIDSCVSNAKSTPHRFSARPDMTTLPLSHPDRTDAGFRPLKALHHFRRLIADKEDTEQVFHIIDALRDKRFGRSVERFFTTPEGRRILAERPYLPALLDDHDALRTLPEGSVGDRKSTRLHSRQ